MTNSKGNLKLIMQMRKYKIVFSQQAVDDRSDLFNFITLECKSLVTAKKYLKGIQAAIKNLEYSAESYQIQTSHFFLRYGSNVRRTNYKRMAIIYTVHSGIVYIHRIIASALITGFCPKD